MNAPSFGFVEPDPDRHGAFCRTAPLIAKPAAMRHCALGATPSLPLCLDRQARSDALHVAPAQGFDPFGVGRKLDLGRHRREREHGIEHADYGSLPSDRPDVLVIEWVVDECPHNGITTPDRGLSRCSTRVHAVARKQRMSLAYPGLPCVPSPSVCGGIVEELARPCMPRAQAEGFQADSLAARPVRPDHPAVPVVLSLPEARALGDPRSVRDRESQHRTHFRLSCVKPMFSHVL